MRALRKPPGRSSHNVGSDILELLLAKRGVTGGFPAQRLRGAWFLFGDFPGLVTRSGLLAMTAIVSSRQRSARLRSVFDPEEADLEW